MSREKKRRQIEQLEQDHRKRARKRSMYSERCICFHEGEQPFFGFEIEWEMAKRVKCPLHGCVCSRGARPIYIPKWHRQIEEQRRETFSPQFHKAWAARFPTDLWPAKEEEREGRIHLRLKNGTQILVRE
jgi:hypothetical protein